MSAIPEQVYLDAARVWRVISYDLRFRIIVESAYRAGHAAAVREILAGEDTNPDNDLLRVAFGHGQEVAAYRLEEHAAKLDALIDQDIAKQGIRQKLGYRAADRAVASAYRNAARMVRGRS